MEFVVLSDYDIGDKIELRDSRDTGTVIDVRCSRIGHSIEFEYLCRYDDTLGQCWLKDYEIWGKVR